MSKQTKQLIALIVLIVVAGGVAAWQFDLLGGDPPPPAPGPDVAGGPVAPGGPTNPAGTTTPAPGGQAGPTGQPAGPGQTPKTQTQDLEIPDEVTLTPTRYEWPVKRGSARDIPDPRFPIFDPLRVQNIDVVDPDRKKYIEQLKEEWVLDGISVTVQERLKIDATGKPMIGESVMEPKPVYEMVPRMENGVPVYGPDGGVVLVKQIVYETDEDGKVVEVEDLDEDGNPRKDKDDKTIMVKKPLYEQQVDENGNPVYDENGNPVWVMQIKYDGGRRVVKKKPLILPRQKIVEGKPQFDENGKPVLVYEPVYVQATDAQGKPKFTKDGEPIYEQVQKRDENGQPMKDENGQPIMVPKPKMVEDQTPQTEVVPVKEAWFRGKTRPFRELDRLTNTRFTISEIFENRVYVQEGSGEIRVRSGVDLLGDTGAKITLFLADDGRYDKGN